MLPGCSAAAPAEGGDRSQTHVICVYVDPFWDDNEMLRVLRGLREHCGFREELKFKADAVTHLNIYKDNVRTSAVPVAANSVARAILPMKGGTNESERGCYLSIQFPHGWISIRVVLFSICIVVAGGSK